MEAERGGAPNYELQVSFTNTSKPYTGAMRGAVHEPQVNIGADQKFSPIDVFNKKRGTNPRISMD